MNRHLKYYATELLLLMPLLFGCGIMVIMSTGDTLNYDSYALLKGVEKGFLEYTNNNSYTLPLTTHYWFSYRMFGNSMAGYNLMSLICSMLTLITIYCFFRKYGRTARCACFLTIVMLGCNRHIIYLSQYAMVTYANSMFLSTLAFFLYYRLSTDNKYNLNIAVLVIAPFFYFSNITLIIPMLTGMTSVFILRMIKNKCVALNKIALMTYEMLPLFLLTLITITVFVLSEFSNIGAVKRPDMDHLFFSRSPYHEQGFGLIKYCLMNSLTLGYELLVLTMPNRVTSVRQFMQGNFYSVCVCCFLLCIAVVPAFVRVIRKLAWKSLSSLDQFAIIFIGLTFLSILAGGIFGVFPFGSARYADYLLLPLVLVVSSACSAVLRGADVIARHRIFIEKYGTMIMFPIIFCVGVFFSHAIWKACKFEKDQNIIAFNKVSEIIPDHIFYTEYVEPILDRKMPDVKGKFHSLGWGATFGQGVDGGENFEKIEESLKASELVSGVRKFAIISVSRNNFLKEYPHWADFFYSRLQETQSVTAPHLWVGVFTKRF